MLQTENENMRVELVISPEGHLYLDLTPQVQEQLPMPLFQRLQESFSSGFERGLLHLGIEDFPGNLPPSFSFWQSFARQFVTRVCKLTSFGETTHLPEVVLSTDELQLILNQVLFIRGAEYITKDLLLDLWSALSIAFTTVLNSTGNSIQSYLLKYNSRWNLVGRICFHLAENKNNEHYPFAFLATYTTQLSQKAVAQHLPLQKALQEYAGEKNHQALLALLLPVQKAAEHSPFIKSLLDSRELFGAQAWTGKQAHSFLLQISMLEACGIMVRVPNWWNAHKPPRPTISIKIGDNQQSHLGLNSLLDFNVNIALSDGMHLTPEEWQELLSSNGGLVKIKGQWVEVDKDKLKAVLSHWDRLQKAAKNGLSMAESLRLLAGKGANLLDHSHAIEPEVIVEWSSVMAGDWLKQTLEQLRDPQNCRDNSVEGLLKDSLQAVLRPYQLKGVQWLWLLYRLQLGGCLADDMGLGKTIQVLALMLLIKMHQPQNGKPHLLVVPASLLSNWCQECQRFTPSLKMMTLHSSSLGVQAIKDFSAEKVHEADVVITTYSFVHRLEWLKNVQWDLLILDEAQLIKNPSAKQTRAIKALKGEVRLSLTGTPLENRLSDLWSLFDFTSPGLLGTSAIFSKLAKNASKVGGDHYSRFVSTLRTLTQPYILRRLKSDKKVISDLPDKTEMQTYCSLSKAQAKLYQQAVEELTRQLEEIKRNKETKGIERRGLVLSFLLRFKQICNHPSQWLGYGGYALEESGKFMRLKEICEEIAAKQEKVLIFTQFREIIAPIAAFLANIFGREGLILHGETPINKRAELVAAFQEERGPPFFVLSLKAGGTGLTLTRAAHVIHFDRWWNPAVENQATDRAYRIGQKHPVLVHKFISLGTVEENIDRLITSKKNLSQELLAGDNELTLTELSNEELLNLVSLDLNRAMAES